jgi:hypothetical protein
MSTIEQGELLLYEGYCAHKKLSYPVIPIAKVTVLTRSYPIQIPKKSAHKKLSYPVTVLTRSLRKIRPDAENGFESYSQIGSNIG